MMLEYSFHEVHIVSVPQLPPLANNPWYLRIFDKTEATYQNHRLRVTNCVYQKRLSVDYSRGMAVDGAISVFPQRERHAAFSLSMMKRGVRTRII